MDGVREQKKQQTRAAILRAAFTLFAEKGYELTSIDELAQVAGIGKGTVYSYFQTKSEILLAFYEEELEFVYRELAVKRTPDGPLIKQLLTLFMSEFKYISRNREFGRQLMREMVFPKEMTVDRSRELDDRYIEVLAPFLRKAQQRGELQQDLPLTFVMAHFYGLYIMTVSGWYMGRLQSIEDVHESMEMLFHQALQGLAANN